VDLGDNEVTTRGLTKRYLDAESSFFKFNICIKNDTEWSPRNAPQKVKSEISKRYYRKNKKLEGDICTVNIDLSLLGNPTPLLGQVGGLLQSAL